MLALIIGIAGLIALLVSFILEEFTKIGDNTWIFNALNIVGSFALGYYAFTLGSIPFLILEGIWGLIAAYKLVLILLKKH